LGVILLLAVNIFGNAAFTSVRLDLTDSKLYTLSTGTRNILSGLDEPVTLRLFLSRALSARLPSINSYTKRVEELLEEYQRAADGKLVVSVVDPEPFSEKEDRAVGYGLPGIPLDEESTFYFGLVATGSTDEEEVIPYLSAEREEFLEYDLTRLIYQVSHRKQKVIGLISSLPLDGMNPQAAMTGRPSPPWAVLAQMRQFFDVRKLDSAIKTIPADIDVLMLVHPKALTDETLYAIDQFVLRGGRTLVFVDPHAEADQQAPGSMGGAPSGRSSELSTLLQVWGLELVPAKVVGDLQWAANVRFQRHGRLRLMEYPVWMNLPPALFNQDDIVTAKLGSLALATPGRLKLTGDAGVQITPLIQSSPNAMQIGTERLSLLSDPEDMLRNYRAEGERFLLAARVTGPAKSAFADGPPATEDRQSKGANKSSETEKKDETITKVEHLAKAKDDINVIIVADTDLLQDQFWVQIQEFLGNRLEIPTAANGAFVVNALDSLTGSNDLISIRSRGRFTRPFTRVNALRRGAELRFREKEQELIRRLQETEQKLTELERSKKGDNTVILTAAQQEEIARFRDEKVRIRKDLRNVRHELRKNIESLEGWMKFVNIGMMPVLIGFGGVIVGSYQIRRRKKGAHTAANARSG
jgi:ABC-type uncharacterized transport system involved in gliding motility auxiliary subunit